MCIIISSFILLNPTASVMEYTQKATICLFFFKQMTVAPSIFTLDGAVQLFWAAFDMPVTGVQ